jgi:hypothetical protein
MAKKAKKASKAKAARPRRAAAKTAARAAAASAATRCELGGPEILPVVVRVPRDAVVDFVLFICLAAARVQVFLDRDLIAEADGQDEVPVRLPQMTVGSHSLMWSHITPSAVWKTRAELASGGATLFRRRKSSDGNNPMNGGFVFLEVQP